MVSLVSSGLFFGSLCWAIAGAFVVHQSYHRSFSMNRVGTSLFAEKHRRIPKLIVFDLDNTLWTPELYQLERKFNINRRRGRNAKSNNNNGPVPKPGRDINLFPGAAKIVDEIRSGKYEGIKFGVASRTFSGDWAHDLLTQFDLRSIIDYVEIFPGDKKQHFANLQRQSGFDYKDMLFFDDARDGRYGNCEPVSELGVLSVHCPDGIRTYDIFENALQCFQEWDQKPGTIVEWDGSVTKSQQNNIDPNERLEGIIKVVNHDKRYGFIKQNPKSKQHPTKDVFFHFNDLPEGQAIVEIGDKISFHMIRDHRNGKYKADSIVVESHAVSSADSDTSNLVTMNAFSMNMPFAALIANEYKTLETRNGTMFVPYPAGTKMLLHVGQRNYPDGNKHIQVMKSGGLNDADIEKLKSLPSGFSKGMIVAVVELGKTYETTVDERSAPEVQRNIAAFGPDSGKMVTEIKRVAYLKKPIPMKGQGGVFKVKLDPELLPDGWSVDEPHKLKQISSRDSPNSPSKSGPIYSISG